MLPKSCDVAIIGAGVIGISTALELAERGLSVVVVEKGRVAGEQSSRNWGWVRKMGRDPREIPLMLESRRLWAGMNRRIGRETGFTVCGITYLAADEKALAAHAAWLESAKGHDVGARLISSAEASALIPGLAKPFAGALYTPDDARAEPSLAVPAMAEKLREMGVPVIENCAARSFETSGGAVSGLVTEHGEMACKAIVLAGGYWSRRFLGNHSIRFPQLGVVNSVMRTAAVEGPSITGSGARFAYRKRRDGGYTIAHNTAHMADLTPDYFRQFFSFVHQAIGGEETMRFRIGRRFLEEARLARRWKADQMSPFEMVRVLDPAPVHGILDAAWKSLTEYLPVFSKASIVERWAGMIDVTPDVVPVIDEVPGKKGLYLSSGFSGHGFGIGPGAGRLTADLVTKTAPVVNPEPFRFNRF